MRVINRFLRRGVNYKIPLLVVAVFVVLGAGILYFTRTSSLCNRENYDMFYFLKALRTNDVQLCEKVSWPADKQRCLAAVEKNDNHCPLFPNGAKDSLCQALGKQDITFCKDDGVCKAFVARNADYCNALETQKDVVDEHLTTSEIESLKRGCRAYANLDAEFFISHEQLKAC